jgi:hypothetical protein
MPDINPEKHYVLDEYRDVVVAGPMSEQAALREVAEKGIEDHIAITGTSLQQVADGRALAWETGEVRQVTDGGAIDNEFEDVERSPETILAEARAEQGSEHELMSGGDLAIDLVTRQPLYIISCAAPNLPAYYEQEEFDLLTYKQHQYLPVRMDDPVFECVFVGDLDDLHHERKTYDYPAGRLARVPLVAQLAEGDAQ